MNRKRKKSKKSSRKNTYLMNKRRATMKVKRYFWPNILDGEVIKFLGRFKKLDEIFETEIQEKGGRDQSIPRKPEPVSEKPQPLNAPKFSLK